MVDLDDRAMDLLAELVGLDREQQRERLDAECAADPELRARVEELLADHREATAEEFLVTSPLLTELATEVTAGDADPPELPTDETPTEIERGGMGVVWRLRDLQFRRPLAVKVMKAAYAAVPDAVRRFFAEACITAQLTHPNIVPVHAAGRLADGRPYYTMKLIEGQKLGALLKNPAAAGRIDFLQVFARVCEAMAFAHQRGVIHRDLKPGNVMAGEHGEVLVIDWGIAKLLAESDVSGADAVHADGAPEDSDHTQPGSVMGTLEYMPREQANGWSEKVDQRSDVFGLGGILCAILTGHPPYVGATKADVIRRAREADLAETYARLESCGADPELIALARACLSADPKDRPADAAAVEERLKKHLASVQDRLRREGEARAAAEARAKEEAHTRREAEKAQRRARWVAAGLAFALLALIVASVFAREVFIAKANREAAEKAHKEDNRRNAIDRALTAAMSGDLEGAQRAIAEAEEAGASPGQVAMLRGQIALHRGRSREAISHLEEAVGQLPASVAARGMLAAAYASDGQWERFDKMIREMESLTPTTPEDFLFQGYAQANLDPDLGLRTIQKAFDGRPMMGIALLLRAEVRAFRAQDTDNPKEAEGAVQDAQYAKELLRSNPTALWVSLNAYLAAAGVYEHRGDAEKRRAALDEARKDAEALEKHTHLPEAVVYRWMYFREVGKAEDAEILAELKKASDETDHVYVAFCYALTLYRRGQKDAVTDDFQEALRVLENKRGTYNDRLLPFVLAEYDYRAAKTDWRDRAVRAADDFAERSKDGLALMNAQSVLWLLGRKDDAVKACAALKGQPDRFYTLRRKPILQCVDYCVSDRSLTAVTELATAVKDRQWDRCLAHYSVGMTKLADGDRHEAHVQFDTVVKTRSFIWGAYDLAWVFESRLKKDPNWPPWITQKKAK